MRKIKLKTECSHLDRIGNIYRVETERQKLLLKLTSLSPPYSCQTEAQQWLLSAAKALSGPATVLGLRWLQGTPNLPHYFSPLCSPSNWGCQVPLGTDQSLGGRKHSPLFSLLTLPLVRSASQFKGDVLAGQAGFTLLAGLEAASPSTVTGSNPEGFCGSMVLRVAFSPVKEVCVGYKRRTWHRLENCIFFLSSPLTAHQ